MIVSALRRHLVVFAGMPEQYYRDWLKVAAEEAYYFTLLSDHLNKLGYAYGDFPAHNGLWDMVSKTEGNVLARMALVPRTLEARGLDASPPMRASIVSVNSAGSLVCDGSYEPYDLKGLRIEIPSALKSFSLRVTTINPWASAVAAIIASSYSVSDFR